jgi:hypothetical protein
MTQLDDWLQHFRDQGASDEDVRAYQASLPAFYAEGKAYHADFDQLIATPADWELPAFAFDTFRELDDWLESVSGAEGADVDLERHVYHWEPPADVPEYPLEQKRQWTVFEFPPFIVVKFPHEENFLRREGFDMQHCLSVAPVAREYCQRLISGEQEQYSLVDTRDGKPRVDMEVAYKRSSYGGPVTDPAITQIRGFRNQCPPADEYLPAIMAFLTDYGGPRGWKVSGHGIRSFDGGVDGDKVVARWRELQGQVESVYQASPSPLVEALVKTCQPKLNAR